MSLFEMVDADGMTALAKVDGILQQRFTHHVTVSGELEWWRDIVAKVEAGYDEIDIVYMNAVDCRFVLEAARSLLPREVVALLDAELAPLDQRFRDATEEVEPALSADPQDWWDRRIPRRLVPPLIDDVRRRGCLPVEEE
jgi:hypothetical protein